VFKESTGRKGFVEPGDKGESGAAVAGPGGCRALPPLRPARRCGSLTGCGSPTGCGSAMGCGRAGSCCC